jgi:hypothetical protein
LLIEELMASTRQEATTTPGSRGLVADVVHDAERLIKLEVALAKQELKDLAVTNAAAVGLVAAGGLLVLLGVLVALPTMVVLLVPWHWQAALVWTAAYLLVGAGLAMFGRARVQVKLPRRTLESLKENKEWALRRMRSTGR